MVIKLSDPVDKLTGKLAAAEAEAERGLAYAHQIEEGGRALAFEIEKLLAENQRLWSRLEARTAEANAYAVKNERLRAEITTWGRMWDDVALLEARAEGLRNGTAILGMPRGRFL